MRVKIIANKKQLEHWSLHDDFIKGKIYHVEKDIGSVGKYYKSPLGYSIPAKFCEEVDNPHTNRILLRDFVALNNIKTTLVSKQLGKSKGWLTQVMNRTDRGDLTDQELQAIMKQLHVDWTNTQYVHVKATKTHSAYRTRPCVYEHAKHKELLQRAFWDGRL